MKRLLCLALALLMALAVIPAFAADEITVLIDGVAVGFDVFPIIENGRTLVPLRAIFEALDATVEWDNDTKTVTAAKGESEISLTIGEMKMTVDGEEKELDVPAKIVDSRTLVPVRAVSESLGVKVDWDGETRTVIITSPAKEAATEDEDEFDGRYFRIYRVSGDRSVAIENASTENSAKVVISDKADNNSQVWAFTAKGNGIYSIVNRASGKSFDVPASSKDEGKEVTQYTVNGGNNQSVRLVEAAGGYRMQFVHSDLYFTASERYVTQEALGDDAAQVYRFEYVGEGIMRSVKESEGYKALDDYTRQRWEDYVFTSRAYTNSIYTQTVALLEGENYVEQASEKQQELLKQCLTFTAFNLVYIGEVANESGATYEIKSKEHIDSYDVWRGSMSEVWKYEAELSDGQKLTLYSTVEDSSVVNDAFEAISRFPYGYRQFLNRIIYRVDGANNYNGGGDTIWIRLNWVPSANSIAQTFAHELSHILENHCTIYGGAWEEAAKADMTPVSGYGNNNYVEDLAEYGRLYWMARGDVRRLAAVEAVYPNRSKLYRAMLYKADNKYFADFREEYEDSLPFIKEDEVYAYISLGGKVLGVKDDSTDNGAQVILQDKNGSDSQLWRVRTTRDGYKVIFNKATGYCLNVPGFSTDEGKNIIVWNGGGGDNERWTVTESADGSVTFKSFSSELFLAINDGALVQSSKAADFTIEQ